MEIAVRDRLILEHFTESDDWSGIVRKLNRNNDTLKSYGGGDQGKRGFQGIRGLPGATGIGVQGERGDKGATIHFVQFSITNGQIVTDETHLEGDAIIDANGVFYSVQLNDADNLVYIFEYSLAAAVSASIVVTESALASESNAQITGWYQRDTGEIRDSHAIFAERVNAGATDEVGLYKVIVGDSKNPVVANSAMSIVNIMPNGAVSAKDSLFHHLAFKYRSAPNTNVSSVTASITYKELNKDENNPIGTDDVYWQFDNVSTGIVFKHDTISTDNSLVVVRGRTTRFWGKTPFDQLYSSGVLNDTVAFLDIDVDTNQQTITSKHNLTIESGGAIVVQANPINSITFNSARSFFSNGVNIGSGAGFLGATEIDNGLLVEGGVAVGDVDNNAFTAAQGILPSLRAWINGDLRLNGDAAITWNITNTGNIDHLWFSDTDNTYNFVADNAYRTDGRTGSAQVRASSFNAGNRIISTNGYSAGTDAIPPANGILTTGAADIGGAITSGGNIDATGNITANLDLVAGRDIYLGQVDGGDAVMRFWDDNSDAWRSFFWDDSANDWRIEDNGGNFVKLWNASNDGSGSGLDADLLDGRQGAQYAYVGTRSELGYVWVRRNEAGNNPALLVTQQNSGRIISLRAGAGDGNQVLEVNEFGHLTTSGRLIANDYIQATSGRMYIGTASSSFTGDAILYFGDGNSNTYRQLFWDDSANDWRIEDNNGSFRVLWHSSNDGSGSGMDADLLDGRQGNLYAYIDTRSTEGYLWIQRNSTSPALYVTNQSSGHIANFRSGSGDGTQRAYIANNGVMYSPDFNVISDVTLKENITPHADDYLKKICDLDIVNYNFKSDPDNDMVGFIAQEVEKVIPSMVITNEEGIKSLSLQNVLPYIIGAIKDLNDKINK